MSDSYRIIQEYNKRLTSGYQLTPGYSRKRAIDSSPSQEVKEKSEKKEIKPPSPVAIATDTQTGNTITVSDEALYAGTYIVGVQGSGKTSILTQIGLKQIEQGNCVIAFDPTTDMGMIQNIVSRIPEERVKDTYIFSLTDDFKFPFGLPVFSYKSSGNIGYQERQATKRRIFTAFEKIWPEVKTQVNFRRMLRNIVPLLLDDPRFTIGHIPLFLQDAGFREKVVAGIQNTDLVRFWKEYGKWNADRLANEMQPFLRRIEDLLDDGYIQYHISQKPITKEELKQFYRGRSPEEIKEAMRFERRLMNFPRLIKEKKIVLIHLPLFLEGFEDAGRIIGIFCMMLIYSAIFAGKDKQVTVLVDEFAKWAIGSASDFRQLLSYGRQYGCQLVLANQYLNQFKEENVEYLISAVTTASTVISMRLNRDDSKYMAHEYVGYRDESEDFPDFEDEELEDEEYEDEKFEERKPTNIYRMVIKELERDTHPDERVKQFYWEYIRPLQDAMKIHPERNQETIQYDFGHGEIKIDPQDIQDFLTMLNDFLYTCEKNESVDKKEIEDTIKPMYGRLLQLVQQKNITPHLLEDLRRKNLLVDEAERALKETEEEAMHNIPFNKDETYGPRIQRKYNALKAELQKRNQEAGKAASMYARHSKYVDEFDPKAEAFAAALYQATVGLVTYPLAADALDIQREKKDWERDQERRREQFKRDQERKREQWQREQERKRERWEEKREEWEEDQELGEEDIAILLKDLPTREGFVKTNMGVYRMRTIDLPQKTTADPQERIKSILTRTKYTYCRGKEEVKRGIDTAFDEPPDSGRTAKPPKKPTQPPDTSAAPESNSVDDFQQHSDRLDEYESLHDF
jgi:hypothetical protein